MPTIAEKWVQEGRKEGKIEGIAELTEKMLQKGLSNADIRDITGLSIKKIEEIRDSLKRK